MSKTIIVGSGISGLCAALQLGHDDYIILEKHHKQWIGGRASNDVFRGVSIVTGAGIGRLHKDKLLHDLVTSYNLESHMFEAGFSAGPDVTYVDVPAIMENLKRQLKKTGDHKGTKTPYFKQLFLKVYKNPQFYADFCTFVGYTDYENEDAYETLYHYGMEDNYTKYQAFSVPWKKLIQCLYKTVGPGHLHFGQHVVSLEKHQQTGMFILTTKEGRQYHCNNVILATTSDTLQKLLPQHPMYNDIVGQPFLRLYGHFIGKSLEIMQNAVKNSIVVNGPLQKIIPMGKGVYMVAYADNDHAKTLQPHMKDKEYIARLLEYALKLEKNALQINDLRDFYWPIGTHYYKPLNRDLYNSRETFIAMAQNPEPGIRVVGEAVSRMQGWTEGALMSVFTE